MFDRKPNLQESHPKPTGLGAPLAGPYRLKRDAMMILARMYAGTPLDAEQFKRQLVFVQSQLVLAAVRDPTLSEEHKRALVAMQEATIRDSIEDRRGRKRRSSEVLAQVIQIRSPRG